MNTIRFSHLYFKLTIIDVSEPVRLIEVLPTNVKYLSKSFLDYDTLYYNKGAVEYYYLAPDMDCIILLFLDSNGSLFTTIRRLTIKKLEYYYKMKGSFFKIEILE